MVSGDTGIDQLAAADHRWRSTLEGFALPIELRLLAGPQTRLRNAVAHAGPFAALVRPDGHIALIADADDTEALVTHLGGYACPAVAPPFPNGRSMIRSDSSHLMPDRGRYVLEPGPAAARLTVSHLFGLGTVAATVDLAGGVIEVVDPIAASRLEVRMDATSFASGNRRRDRDVRARGLLDTDRWPDLTFTAERLDATADTTDGAWRTAGTLTVHGQPHPVVVDVTIDTVDVDGFTLSARAALDRRHLGVTGKPGMIGNQISLEVKARAVADHATHRASSTESTDHTLRRAGPSTAPGRQSCNPVVLVSTSALMPLRVVDDTTCRSPDGHVEIAPMAATELGSRPSVHCQESTAAGR